MSHPIDLAVLLASRERNYRRLPDLAVGSEQEALAFVNSVGFSFLFPVRSHELPSLWEAINGRIRPLPEHFDDRALDWTWEWKDSLPAQRLCYYGKLLKRKPTLVSLDLLPYFFALSDNTGDLEDYLENYQDGKLSEDAKRVYEALLEHGAQPTSRLRVLAGMPARQGISRFDRAITELQAGLYIAKSGISDANAWKYCYVYDLLPRRYPEAIARAADIPGKIARLTLAARYLSTVVVTNRVALARLFDWDEATAARVIAGLLSEGIAEEIDIGQPYPWLRAIPT